MKKWKYFVMFLAALALLALPAYAGEMEAAEAETEEAFEVQQAEKTTAEPEGILLEQDEEPVIWTELPELINEKTGFPESVSLLEASEWPATATRYRDQLSVWGQSIYDSMESAFADGKEQYKNVTFQYKDASGRVDTKTEFCAVYQKEIGRVSRYDQAMNQRIDEYRNKYGPELNLIWLAFTYDHPEIFWIRYNGGGNIALEEAATEYGILVDFSYVIDTDAYSTTGQRGIIKTALDNAVKDIRKKCQDISDVAILAYFDEWLAENNVYNSSAASSDMDSAGAVPWNATSALGVGGTSPVCEGYAKAFQLLCHESGIPCVTVSSSDHMWNMVRVDNKWYHMDCTWNDNNNYSNRVYFLVANAQIGNDTSSSGVQGSHVIKQDLACPSAASSDYFVDSEGWTRSENKISGYISGNGNSGNECWFALYSSQNQLVSIMPCAKIQWGQNYVRYIAPEFNSSILSKASSGKSFIIDANWKPVAAAAVMN